jgi:hypothetical protein
MKNLLLFTALIFTFFGLSQELPMKDGMVYYKFEHNEKNTKKCLSKYVSDPLFPSKIISETRELTTNKDSKWNAAFKGTYNLILSITPDYNATGDNDQCPEKVSEGFMYLQLPTSAKTTTLYNLGKKKISSQTIKCKVTVKFIDKDSYAISFKGFTYEVMGTEGLKIFTEEHPLEEIHEKETGSSERKIFADIDYMINGCDKIVQEVISGLYKTDELD